MTRFVNAARAATACLLLSLSSAATAQVQNALDRERGLPAGLALPVIGAAAAEEPSALETNAAGIGFVPELALQWFHEQEVTPGSRADGLYAADAVGPLGVGFGIQWIRPGGDAARYRKTTLALATSDTRTFSLAFAWNWWGSRDAALERLSSWDVGLTVRPTRHLSFAAVMRDRDARLGGAPLPVRYDLGVAARVWRDALTLSADLLADDRARDDFHTTHLAFGALAELRLGLALGLQIQVPLRDDPLADDVNAVVALSWNGPHGGWTGGATAGDRTGWLVGARASRERYRSAATGHDVPAIDVEDALEPARTLAFLRFGDPDPYGTLLQRLEAVRDDPEVAAVVLKIEGLPLGAGRSEELRGALARIRERKPVLVYLTGGGTSEYWLATGATAIAAPPGAALFVNGAARSTLFVRDALARLGVTVEVVKRGAYKSAPEPLVRSDASPEAREMTNAVLDDVFARVVADVAAARKLPPERVRALVDEGLFGAEEGKAAGLLDEVLWEDELEQWARRFTGRRVQLAKRWEPEQPRRAQRWGPASIVEIVRVEGTIAQGKSRGGGPGVGTIAGAETVAEQIRRAADDRAVKAIVLRIESPGGDGLASDLLWREVVRAKRRKPVVASMGDYAASGGYLAAVGADVVVAEPSTLTGSIGVFALKPDLTGMLGKLSISRESAVRGRNAELRSVTKAWTESERAAVERQIERFYRTFVERVAEGRKLPPAEVEASAGGRVWTGRQALDRRLVDQLGSLSDAVAVARDRAKLGAGDLVLVRRAGGGAGPLGGALAKLAPSAPASGTALTRLVAAVPELAALALVAELGPVVALPVEWVGTVTDP
jgi:protease-4